MAELLDETLATEWYGKRQGTGPELTSVSAAGRQGPEFAPEAAFDTEVLGDRYRLHETLGAGAFARVYRGWDLRLRRWVAVKVYPVATGRICADEARLQATCQHPNLMPLHDAGTDSRLGVSFLVMPLYSGSDLAATLNRYDRMPFRAAVQCVDQICSALEYLWQRRGIPHGDVKPANVWLTHGAAVLLDFNLTGLLIRQAPARAGTPGYTAPEALAGQVDARSDVFSLGCVLYCCLAGIPPFADDVAARAGACVPLRQLRPEVHPSLAEIVHTAIHPDPNQRFQSARELQTALRLRQRGTGFQLDWERMGQDLWWLLQALARPLWRFIWWLLRFTVRRPLRTLLAVVGAYCTLRWILRTIALWLGTHLLPTAAILLLASMIGTVSLAMRWRRR